MTRLTATDLSELAQTLPLYDTRLKASTGLTLSGLAGLAAGLDESNFMAATSWTRMAVVPFSTGQGIITGFAESVAAILEYLGFEALVTINQDVSGLAEAFERRADVIFMADDDRFVAINVRTNLVVDNAKATGRVFALALEAMAGYLVAGGLAAQETLIIGCGRVGQAAAWTLAAINAGLVLYDIDPHQSGYLAAALRGQGFPVLIAPDLEQALAGRSYIIDASPAAGIIAELHLTPSTFVAAPGVPLGLTPDAARTLGTRLIHDPLTLGVAAMAVMVVAKT